MVFDFEKAKKDRENNKKKREKKRRREGPLFQAAENKKPELEMPTTEEVTEKVFDTESRTFKVRLVLSKGDSIVMWGIKSDTPQQAIDKAVPQLHWRLQSLLVLDKSSVIDADTMKEYNYANEEVV